MPNHTQPCQTTQNHTKPHKTTRNHVKPCQVIQNLVKPLITTIGNIKKPFKLKKARHLSFSQNVLGKKERRTKQSLDSPQTIEANKKIDKNSSKINNIPYPALQQTGHKGSAYLSANYFLKAASA